MVSLYVLLQLVAMALMIANFWVPAVIVAIVALTLTMRGLLRSARPVKAPRPHRF